MKKHICLGLLALSPAALSSDISETEVTILIVLGFASYLIPVVALFFIIARKGISAGNKLLWSVFYLVFWFILGKTELLFLLYSPMNMAIYLQFSLYIIATAVFVYSMYRFTRPTESAAEEDV